ncbi:MAG: toll/interleukin-1 receptor domain-containing protein [Anaerolineae bacterium]
MPGKYKVFISHTGKDTWIARQIEACINNYGADAFLDVADITVGEEFDERIRQELLDCDELVALLTPWSLERPYVLWEMAGAWVQGKRIVGILHGLTAEDISSEKHIPVSLKCLNLIDINNLDMYLNQLKERIKEKSEGK